MKQRLSLLLVLYCVVVLFILPLLTQAIQLQHQQRQHESSSLNPSESNSNSNSNSNNEQANFLLPLAPIGLTRGNEGQTPLESVPSIEERMQEPIGDTVFVRGDQVSKLPEPNPLPQLIGVPVIPD